MKSQKVWFVTGASKGLGLTLVRELLAQDYLVVATSRTKQTLEDKIGDHENFLPLEVDITNDADVNRAVLSAIDYFGRIDVLVNNAGYGQTGALEELSDLETRRNYDVNVFGSLNFIRHITPYLRRQQSGHIFNIASIGGLVGNFPAFGIYCSTKFAVAGFTEALAVEMQPFGVHTTLVYPGYFRTEFLSENSIHTAANPIADYISARETEAAHLQQIHGNQANDPQRAAMLLIELSTMSNPPFHFLMGEDAYELAKNKINALTAEIEKWKSYTVSTGFERSVK
ncbi:SDR family NAD(P)-dependent oxidoreductase [Sphingobacterium sp. BIGb0165]|uniref:SDR family NAD(P)-dependent oxidoreductase n=1 Tax=Sphingobacterium sp. BIGb0165 TaxID=2940615 RepID=UPI00216AA4ED|nr:SDR family NAD(P)-dependent oxidoreductase [Sphingobacterium sp. BIGb0165]MCS4229055.1 NAD(P)-dependent dehydrogenase (short-subunit alcohol dehydrogenase family) [Sphingobacterium sp. BIGb0165]